MRRRKTHFEQVPIEAVEKILRQQTRWLNKAAENAGRVVLAASLDAKVLSGRGIPEIRGGKYPFKEQP